MPISSQWLNYLHDQYEFCESLRTDLRYFILVRIFPHDYGWYQTHRWQDRFPEIEIDTGHEPIKKSIDRSGLYVSTYNATTYLEAFAMNVPTVMFWNPDHWEIRDFAKQYFEELERVKVFHKTPKSASKPY